jgi:hypothetical protein
VRSACHKAVVARARVDCQVGNDQQISLVQGMRAHRLA